MGLATFRPGCRIRLDGVMFELTGRLPSNKWQLMEIDTGLRDEQTDDDLWKAYLTNHLRFVQNDPNETATQKRLLERMSEAAETMSPSCSEWVAQAALSRWKFVQQVSALKGLLPIDDAIDEAWKAVKWPATKPCIRTAQYWCAKVAAASDPVTALVQKDSRKGNRTARYPAEVIEIADRIVQDKYLKKNPRISMTTAAKECARELRKENRCRPRSEQLPVPGRRMFESRVALIPKRERIAKRHGSDVALARFRTSLGGIKTTHVLERGEVDHTTLAIVLLDEDFMPWGRASCSLCVDGHIPIPTGIYLGAEIPSIVSVSHCTERSLLPKTELLKRYPDVKGRWDCYGVHETYVYDNGLEEHASALRHALSELGGSTAEFCARKAPWYKPNVERYFRTQDLDLLQTLPGCTGENIFARPAFDPKKDVLVRRSTFEKVYMIWLVDIYLRESLVSLGNISLAEAWKRSIILEEQLVPTRRILLERLFLRKEPERTLDHEGIQFDCLIYNSTDMGALRAELGAKLKVDIWVSDEDLGYIFVEVPRQDISIRVPCLDQHYASGLTRWQHDKCKDMQRIGKDEGLQLTLDDARERIGELIDADLKECRHARRKTRTRFTERAKSAPSTGSAEPQNEIPETRSFSSAADEALMRSEEQATIVLPCTSLQKPE